MPGFGLVEPEKKKREKEKKIEKEKGKKKETVEFGGAEKYGEWNIKVMISPNPPRKAGTVSL